MDKQRIQRNIVRLQAALMDMKIAFEDLKNIESFREGSFGDREQVMALLKTIIESAKKAHEDAK